MGPPVRGVIPGVEVPLRGGRGPPGGDAPVGVHPPQAPPGAILEAHVAAVLARVLRRSGGGVNGSIDKVFKSLVSCVHVQDTHDMHKMIVNLILICEISLAPIITFVQNSDLPDHLVCWEVPGSCRRHLQRCPPRIAAGRSAACGSCCRRRP